MVIFRKPRSGAASPACGTVDWPVYLFIAAAFTLVYLNIPIGARVPELILRDPDNNMRLVQVRDFLAGQSWWDVSQHRLGFGEPDNMHWSRLADIPLIVLITVFSWFVEPARAEVWAVVVEPPLFLIPALVFLAHAATNIAGPIARTVVRIVAITSPPFVSQFVPGRIDHHHLQLTLLAGALAALAGRETFRNGALAGAAMALSLVIGLETAPLLVAGAGALALRWASDEDRVAPMLRGFAIALPAALVAFYILSVPPSDWVRATYDQVGRGHLAAIALGSAMLWLVLRRPATTPAMRIGQLALSALPLVPVVLIAPELLRGPYDALDPALYALWLDNIAETASIIDLWRAQPHDVPLFFAFPIAAFVAAILLLRNGQTRGRTMLALAMLGAGLLLTMVQVRAAPGASTIAAVLAASAIAAAWHRRTERLGWPVLVAGVLLLNGLTGMGLKSAFIATRPTTEKIAIEEKDAPRIADCEAALIDANLDAEPPGLVLSGLDSGPVILMRSHHSVLSAGYHRNIEGTGTAISALLEPADTARAMLRRAGVDYVLFCPSLDFGGFAGSTARSLGARLAAGDPPAWLALRQGGRQAGYAFYAVR